MRALRREWPDYEKGVPALRLTARFDLDSLRQACAAEPDLAVALAEGQRRHVEGARTIVGLLAAIDALDGSVDADAAVATLAAISDVRFAVVLRDNYGWSLDRIEAWIAATSTALLLQAP